MATYYCDLYAGNDSNDGLTTSTPKLTINAATALVTKASDEVKVRGMDSLFTDIGSWTWTNETLTVTRIGNYTGSTAANDFICKTVAASGTTTPEIYKVSSVAYNVGTNTTTITLASGSATYHYYIGTTETVPTSKIILPSSMAAQFINKSGYLSGTQSDLTGRVLSKVTGGWSSGYTTQNSFTIWYNNGTSSSFISYNVQRWEISRFILLGGSQHISSSVGIYTLNNISSCNSDGNVFYFYSTSDNYVKNSFISYLNVINSGYILGVGTVVENTKLNIIRRYNISFSVARATDCVFAGANNTNMLTNTNNKVDLIRCILHNKNKQILFKAFGTGAFNCTGCTFVDFGTTENISVDTGAGFGNTTTNALGNLVNCTFDLNRNRSNGMIVGYFNGQNGVGIKPTTFYGQYGNMIGCSGLSTTNKVALDVNGLISSTSIINAKISNSVTTFTNLRWYNNNNENFMISGYTSNSNKYLNAIIYQSTGNTKLEKYGYTTLSDDYYTGKTGTTGATNSVLHVVGTNTAECDFNNVDFVIDKTNAYNLSFYAKGSGSYTLHWNILNGGQYLYAWQTQAITAGGWQQITKAISASDWKMSGTATLVIRIPSQAKGTYALIDYIQLT